MSDVRTHGIESELLIVEGDSAAGPAKAGRNSETQAVLPLRGKVVNAGKSTMKQVLDNAEAQALFTAIGAGSGNRPVAAAGSSNAAGRMAMDMGDGAGPVDGYDEGETYDGGADVLAGWLEVDRHAREVLVTTAFDMGNLGSGLVDEDGGVLVPRIGVLIGHWSMIP